MMDHNGISVTIDSNIRKAIERVNANATVA